jgi:hypothetical protein
MATLPHFKNSKAATSKWEPVYKNLFEVTILPPPSVTGGSLLLEHVNSITGLTTELGQEVTEQTFKTAKRSFLSSVPVNTVVDLVVNFSLNLNDNNEMYVYKTLRDWKRLGYNPLTGEMGLKKDYTQDTKIIVTQYNRKGDIFWQRTFNDVFIVGNLPEFTLDYSSADVETLEVTFRSDWWQDTMA